MFANGSITKRISGGILTEYPYASVADLSSGLFYVFLIVFFMAKFMAKKDALLLINTKCFVPL